ncbi:hypothetical protein VEL46_004244 [Cronobacter sakazakii]|nr:hypothetical protein [Cronobacter sakazakii]EMC4238802.1 hypothetical protein [Cronobacter sakazakii]EMC4247072.1 hypothetical protein [Cronobacter sakazakii]EMC4251243.1 hypothetical protein [Cronobacter sakazakii]EMC4259582.1 hypothetical protein [Cronobacter sakazakii]
MTWTPVNGAQNMPIGKWLVQLSDGDFAVAKIHEEVQVVGGNFHFDVPPVVAYMPLPVPYQGVTNEKTNV